MAAVAASDGGGVPQSTLGNELQTLLSCSDIQPGDSVSYQLCKTIYLYHPLGAKMADQPISLAQSQPREISVAMGPEERVKERFIEMWDELGADDHIHNAAKTARVYGISSLALLADGVPENRPIDFKELSRLDIAFNVLDPLNTAGSLVLNQDPNALDFQKHTNIAVNGRPYHRSRALVVFNEKPIYISYTASGFGYVGRSVYQRALYPLKSYIQSMVTDDMVTRKAGIIVVKLKPAGSIVNSAMNFFAGLKRNVVKEAETNNVISITTDEEISAIDLVNVSESMSTARKNVIENIATAADMPAKLLLQESFAAGFGEGSEDAKYVAHYIDRMRESLSPLYSFMDKIVQYRAWTPEFYKTIQNDYPSEYGSTSYTEAFYQWRNSFKATWPSLLTEPDSDKVETDDVKLRAIISSIEAFMPSLDPDNRARMLQWAADNINENKFMFQTPLSLDAESLRAYLVETAKRGEEQGQEEKTPGPSNKLTRGDAREIASDVVRQIERQLKAQAPTGPRLIRQ